MIKVYKEAADIMGNMETEAVANGNNELAAVWNRTRAGFIKEIISLQTQQTKENTGSSPNTYTSIRP